MQNLLSNRGEADEERKNELGTQVTEGKKRKRSVRSKEGK
jgi:hypothetical protein